MFFPLPQHHMQTQTHTHTAEDRVHHCIHALIFSLQTSSHKPFFLVFLFIFQAGSSCRWQVCVSVSVCVCVCVCERGCERARVLFCSAHTHIDRASKHQCKARGGAWERGQQQMSLCNERPIQAPFTARQAPAYVSSEPSLDTVTSKSELGHYQLSSTWLWNRRPIGRDDKEFEKLSRRSFQSPDFVHSQNLFFKLFFLLLSFPASSKR